jgi:uncharacterized protein YkwD
MKKLNLNTLFFFLAAFGVLSFNSVTAFGQNAVNQSDKDGFVTLISQYRTGKGLGALTMDETLRLAAQNYADVLEQTGKTGHTVPSSAPNGKTVTSFEDRVGLAALSLVNNDATKPFVYAYLNLDAIKYGAPANFWIKGTQLGEILTYGWSTPQQAIDAFMKSAAHNSNMLDSRWTKIGVGISRRKLGDGSFSGFNWVIVMGNPNTDAKSQITLDGTYQGKVISSKYQYYSNYIKK